MPSVLLRPQFLSWKNKLKKRIADPQSLLRDVVLILVLLAIGVGTFYFIQDLLLQIIASPGAANFLPGKILNLSWLFFFILLLFSSFVGALGHFYTSSDLPLLLALPISRFRLFISRFIETSLKASWMFLLLCIPTLLAYKSVFQLPFTFMIEAMILLVPFVVIPCSISATMVTVLVNLVPADKLREAMAGLFALITIVFFYIGQSIPVQMSANKDVGLTSLSPFK